MTDSKHTLAAGLFAAAFAACTPVLAQTDTICTLENRFSSVNTYAVGANPGQVELADLDQDGNLDAVVLNRDSGSFTVLRGDFGTKFTHHTQVLTGKLPIAQEFADVDHDGFLDLLIVDAETDDIAIFLNSGDAHFVEHSRIQVGERSRSIKVGDFNNDGYTDIVCVHQQYQVVEPTVEILFGGPDVTFTEPIGLFDDLYANDVSIADFNNDGHADIAALEGIIPGANHGRVYLGDGDGTFNDPNLFNSRRSAISSTVADMNNDGHLDIISISRIEFSVIIHYGDGTGAFDEYRQLELITQAANVSTAYLNKDNLLDIVVSYDGTLVGEAGGISLFESREGGTYSSVFVPNTGLTSWVAVADLNHDGQPDFVAPDRAANVLEIFLDQCGTCPADLNGDGELDFLDVSLLLNPVSGANIFLDYNRDGSTDFYDISAFLTDFSIGCN